MPCLKIFTNLSKNKIPDNFVSNLLPILSKTIKKAEDRFIVVISSDCSLAFGHQDSRTVAAVATLESIGNLGLEENKFITKEVTEYVHKELGIAPDNFLITFYDINGQNAGKGGVTLEDRNKK